MNDLDPRLNDEPRVEPREKIVSWQMGQPGQDSHLGSTLKDMITAILARNVNFFALTTVDMSGIDPRIISHKLSICKEVKPITQNKRRMG